MIAMLHEDKDYMRWKAEQLERTALEREDKYTEGMIE
jgi:hypothetical protein